MSIFMLIDCGLIQVYDSKLLYHTTSFYRQGCDWQPTKKARSPSEKKRIWTINESKKHLKGTNIPPRAFTHFFYYISRCLRLMSNVRIVKDL